MEVDKLLLNAMQTNKFIEFLEGKDHMDIGHSSHFSNLAFPTDWAEILENGIYKLYKDGCKYNIKQIFEKSIIYMLDGKVFDVYCAIGIWYIQLKQETNSNSPFSLDRQLLVEKIKKSLVKNKEELVKFYEWQGRNEKEGMWGYIKKINQGCIAYYGFEIL